MKGREPSTVLLIEDNPGDAGLLREAFKEQNSNTTVAHAESMSAAEKYLAEHAVDLILLDLGLPDSQGLGSLRRAHAAAPRVPLVVLTGLDDEALAVQALQEGAQDYLIKGQLETRGLVRALRYAMERKALEDRLSDSEEEYRLLFDSNPHPMWVFDSESLEFLAVNDAAVRLYGFSRQEFLAMTIREIRPVEEVPALLEYLATIPDSPSLKAVHVKHRKKDGSLVEVEGASNPIELHGRHARLVLVDDVTERKELEAQLMQAQKMEAVGRLAGGVAHDFNNLLGVITGYSELLLEGLGPQHPESAALEQIQKAAERGAGLTRQLLAFSRKLVLQPRILDLDAVVAEMGKMLRRLIGEDIQLVMTPCAALGHIRADPGQIEQVVMNLVVNSRDAMPKGGQLAIETANVELDEAYARAHLGVEPGPFVMLSVCDTGEGMDAQTLAHLFEPFFTTKEASKGTGLGLATVFGIVQQSGGTVSVDSLPGMGTTFKIYFPRVEGEVWRPAQARTEDRPPTGKETVLLVEDADALRVLIRRMLEAAGYSVLEYSDPEEALAGARTLEAPIHLLLTDVVMPGMSGPDLARSVQAARPGIRVLFMSGYTDEAMGLHGVLAAVTQFIQKPFTKAVLRRKVREALDEPDGLGWEPAPVPLPQHGQSR